MLRAGIYRKARAVRQTPLSIADGTRVIRLALIYCGWGSSVELMHAPRGRTHDRNRNRGARRISRPPGADRFMREPGAVRDRFRRAVARLVHAPRLVQRLTCSLKW